MKLAQGQVWKNGAHYLRITQLERLKVGYKEMPDLASRDGHHREVTKKEFCRLIKTAKDYYLCAGCMDYDSGYGDTFESYDCSRAAEYYQLAVEEIGRASCRERV